MKRLRQHVTIKSIAGIVLPLVLFLVGYLVTMSGWGGCAGFLLGIGAVIVYDRLVAKKEQIQYTITGYARKKGDNDLG